MSALDREENMICMYLSQIKFSQKCKKCMAKDGKYAKKTAGKDELGMYGICEIVMDGNIAQCMIFSVLSGALCIMTL